MKRNFFHTNWLCFTAKIYLALIYQHTGQIHVTWQLLQQAIDEAQLVEGKEPYVVLGRLDIVIFQ